FLPTDPRALAAELEARHLSMVGAFVDVALTDPAAHDAGEATAIRTARLLTEAVRQMDDIRLKPDTTYEIAVGGERGPMIVLSDATARVPARAAKAGRITPADGLTDAQWAVAAAGAEQIARGVRDRTGLRTVFHPHCATYVETPDEIDALMRRTPGDLLG